MPDKLAKELLQQLSTTREVEQHMSIQLDKRAIETVRKYRSVTKTEKGTAGKLESYAATVAKLIQVADEHISELMKQSAAKDPGAGKPASG